MHEIERDRPAPAPAARLRAAFAKLRDLLTPLVWSRVAVTMLAALIGGGAAIAIGASLTPRYSATAQLHVDTRDTQAVDRIAPGPAPDDGGLAMAVASQARLLRSNNVLLRVVEATTLERDPEFGAAPAGGIAALFGWLGIESRATADSPEIVALENLRRHSSVQMQDHSFIVDVEVWSIDPAKAAKLANAICDAYFEELKKSQAIAARRLTSDLSDRLTELQQRLRNAETALADYKAQNDLAEAASREISEQQLAASNQRLAAARAATQEAEARYDRIESSLRASTDIDAMADALPSATLASLRAQYARARARYAELTTELGPLNPALRQLESRIEELRRAISDEVERLVQSARDDLERARAAEAALDQTIEKERRQSAQIKQVLPRLRELEGDVEASRDVYQTFLRRWRENGDQESLKASNARVIGVATVPQQPDPPPELGLWAAIGAVLGAAAAAAWLVQQSRISKPIGTPAPQAEEHRASGASPGVAANTGASRHPSRLLDALRFAGILGMRSVPVVTNWFQGIARRVNTGLRPTVPHSLPADQTQAPRLAPDPKETVLTAPVIAAAEPPPAAAAAANEKPLIARLQETAMVRMQSEVLGAGALPDLTRLGWPTLGTGLPVRPFLKTIGEIRATMMRRPCAGAIPVIAIIGADASENRAVAALNVALAAARNGARVLLIDADHGTRTLSERLDRRGRARAGRFSWLGIGARPATIIETSNGIAVLVADRAASMTKSSDRICRTIAEVRSLGGYDLVILDGPAMPWRAAESRLLDTADGLVAVLPVNADINDCVGEIIRALGDAERKLVGFVLNELHPATAPRREPELA